MCIRDRDADIKVALDMTEEWDKCVTDGSQLTMGCVVARTEFVEENKEAVDRFLEEYAASVEFVNGNVEDAAALSGKFDVIAEAVAAKAIPKCNIVFWEGEQMKKAAEGFLTVLHLSLIHILLSFHGISHGPVVNKQPV